MHIFPIQSFGEAGIRLFLCFTFTLLLLTFVADHVDSSCFVAADISGQHHEQMHSNEKGLPSAELQEEEFDEAVIPKTLHEVLPALAPSEPFRLERPAYSPDLHSARVPAGRSRVCSSAPPVLRC